MHENRETSKTPEANPRDRPAGEGKSHTARMHVFEESDSGTVCAEQRIAQEGSSPSGARMRSAISERGGNASRAGKGKQVWRSLNGHKGESRTQPRRTWSRSSQHSGGQGVHREVESEGHEEKYRAVIDGGHPEMNRSAKGGARSSLHYEGEGVLIHPPHQGVCGWHGTEE